MWKPKKCRKTDELRCKWEWTTKQFLREGKCKIPNFLPSKENWEKNMHKPQQKYAWTSVHIKHKPIFFFFCGYNIVIKQVLWRQSYCKRKPFQVTFSESYSTACWSHCILQHPDIYTYTISSPNRATKTEVYKDAFYNDSWFQI